LKNTFSESELFAGINLRQIDSFETQNNMWNPAEENNFFDIYRPFKEDEAQVNILDEPIQIEPEK